MSMKNTNIENLIIHYLDGSIGETESKQLLSWLKESADNEKIFLDYYSIWSSSKKKEFDENKALEQFIEIMEKDNVQKTLKHKINIYKYAGIAAACAIIILLAIPFFNKDKEDIASFAGKASDADFNDTKTTLILSENKSVQLEDKEANIQYDAGAITINEENKISKEESSSFNQLIIPFGKRSVVTFADGTKAWINSGTRLVYPVEFKKEYREVFVDGEIYLEVAEDKLRPFIVKSADMDIKVLGTRFNVSVYESEKVKSVVLVSGAVKVSPKEKGQSETILKPNQMFKNENGHIYVENVDAKRYILWIDGFYIFDSTELGDILTRLSRYYNKKIIYDSSVSTLRCTGKLDMKDDLGEVLLGLTHTVPILFEYNDDGSYIIKTKN